MLHVLQIQWLILETHLLLLQHSRTCLMTPFTYTDWYREFWRTLHGFGIWRILHVFGMLTVCCKHIYWYMEHRLPHYDIPERVSLLVFFYNSCCTYFKHQTLFERKKSESEQFKVPTSCLQIYECAYARLQLFKKAVTADSLSLPSTNCLHNISILQRTATHSSLLQSVAVCCSVLQYVAVCCSVLQYVAVSVSSSLDFCLLYTSHASQINESCLAYVWHINESHLKYDSASYSV